MIVVYFFTDENVKLGKSLKKLVKTDNIKSKRPAPLS